MCQPQMLATCVVRDGQVVQAFLGLQMWAFTIVLNRSATQDLNPKGV